MNAVTAFWSNSELRLFVDAAYNESCHLVYSKLSIQYPTSRRVNVRVSMLSFYENLLIQEAKCSTHHLVSCDAKIIFTRAGIYNLQAILTGQ